MVEIEEFANLDQFNFYQYGTVPTVPNILTWSRFVDTDIGIEQSPDPGFIQLWIKISNVDY